MPVFLPIVSALGIAATAALWIAYGLPGLVAISGSALSICRDIFVFCTGYLEAGRLAFIWAGSFIAVAGVLYGITNAVRRSLSSDLAIRRLPLYHKGGPVVLILDKKVKTAFTHGLLRPRIYISKGLIDSLDRAELKAVMLHELCHKRRWDPLRFLLYSMIADTFFYIPILKEAIKWMRIKKETEADSSACKDLSERLTLAGAIVKAASFNLKAASFAPSITGDGPTRSRVESLIKGRPIIFKTPERRTIALSLIGAAIVASSVAMPLLPGAVGATQMCTTEHCVAHIERLGDECRRHCEVSGSSHRH